MPELLLQSDSEEELESDLKYFFETTKKFPTELIEGWLIFRGKLQGISPIITFNMINPSTGILTELYICNNKQYSFNDKGLSPAGFKPGGIRRFMFDTLMEKIQIPVKDSNVKIKDSLEEGLRRALVINGKINVQLLHVYKLKYPKILIDYLMEKLFWHYFEIKKARWKTHWEHDRNPVLKRVYKYFRNKSRINDLASNTSGLCDTRFNFYINDQSSKIQQLKTEIKNSKLEKYNKNNFLQFYRRFQQINHRSIIHLNTSFTYQEICSFSKETGLGGITDTYSDFIRESNKEGITRALASIIHNKTLRLEITQLTTDHALVNPLDLSNSVFSEDKWGRVVTNQRSSIDFPDIVTYNKMTLIAEEKIQVKVIPHSPTKYLQYRYEEILSDYIKSISCHDPVTNTGLKSFRIEYIPIRAYVPSFGSIPTRYHTVIIHYWGNVNPKYQRLGEIYNAIRLGFYNYDQTKKEDLLKFVRMKLKSGDEMLSGRKLLETDEEIIADIYAIYMKGMQERQFIYLALIKILSLLQ
ncbi:hypothetical protein CEE45_01380 [Candidatus Heimdallarchaeota archaeon B3_Heim]|nr:MAG: hypothetical protein CEE45_01380 [Candidatus Heimdallarchaeota archaeon B3_Heim]